MARPKKKKHLLMNAHLRIPLTEDQKKLIEEAASIVQSDMTAWVRPILLQAAANLIEKRRVNPSDGGMD